MIFRSPGRESSTPLLFTINCLGPSQWPADHSMSGYGGHEILQESAPSTRLATKKLAISTPTTKNDKSSQRVSPGSARSLLLTLLGEFVLPRGRPVWTSTLVYVLVGVGIAEKAARQAISRAASAGWIQSHPVGRQTCWTLSDHGRSVINEGAERVRSMSRRSTSWDGRWLVLVTTFPETLRAQRMKLYRALNWVGFGNPTPSLWINPHPDREDEARQVLLKLKLSRYTFAFVGPSLQIGLTDRQIVKESWDLDKVSRHYDGLIKHFTKLRPQSGDSVLFTHVQLVNEWQTIPFIDPGLPAELLPPLWGGLKAAARLESIREQWRVAAHNRWDEVAGVVPSL